MDFISARRWGSRWRYSAKFKAPEWQRQMPIDARREAAKKCISRVKGAAGGRAAELSPSFVLLHLRQIVLPLVSIRSIETEWRLGCWDAEADGAARFDDSFRRSPQPPPHGTGGAEQAEGKGKRRPRRPPQYPCGLQRGLGVRRPTGGRLWGWLDESVGSVWAARAAPTLVVACAMPPPPSRFFHYPHHLQRRGGGRAGASP